MSVALGSIVTIAGLGLGSYLVYKALSAEYGSPIDNAHNKFRTTTNYYSDDQLTEDLHSQVALSGQLNVMQLDTNLYNVDVGSGGYIQVDNHGLKDMITNNQRSTRIVTEKPEQLDT